MTHCQSTVRKLYQFVIEDVIQNCRDTFTDEGIDEQVLLELKHTWETKLNSAKAVQPPPNEEVANPLLPTHSKALVNGKNVSQGVPIHTQGGAIVKKVIDNAQARTSGVSTAATSSSTVNTTAQPPVNPTPVPSAPATTTSAAAPDLGRMVPIQITLPPVAGSVDTQSRVLNIQVPAAALQGNQLHQVLNGPIMTATLALPAHVASSLLQQHITAAFQSQIQAQTSAHPPQRNVTQNGAQSTPVAQIDGVLDIEDSSDDDDDDLDDDAEDDEDDADEDKDESNHEESAGKEEEPLNSGDDVSDDETSDQFDTDNVVVCQYDKVTRSRNKWKFYLKDGIMNLNGRDFVFQKANGDAEW